jgi:hypothetical protein
MTNTLTILYDPDSDFCQLSFRYNRRFQALLSAIKPSGYRSYNKVSKKWSVHYSKLPMVVSWGRRHFAHVDYSALPDHLQIKIAQMKEQQQFSGALREALRTPYDALYLVPGAPLEVVKAVYKVMAIKTHPDHGGSAEAFRAVQEAYEAILAELNS